MPKKDEDNEKPSETVLEEQPEVVAVESGSPSGDVRPPTGIDRSKIGPKALAMAKELGIDLEPVFVWAESVDARFEAIQENLPDAVGEAVERTLINLQKKSMQDQRQAMHDAIDRGEMPRGGGSPQGGGSGQMQMLMSLLSSGGGGNEMMEKLQAEMLRASIDGMKAGAANSRAITNAVVQKITGKAIGEAVGEIAK